MTNFFLLKNKIHVYTKMAQAKPIWPCGWRNLKADRATICTVSVATDKPKNLVMTPVRISRDV
jgi:hypothetical protein